MIIEQHYDDDVLLRLLEEAGASDPHLPVCESCSGALENFRDLTGALHDDSVWDDREVSEEPKTETLSMLRSFVAGRNAEAGQAGRIVAKLLALPAAEAPILLGQHPEWCTAGVVRKLIEAVDKSNFVDPKAAAEWAALAVTVAEALDPGAYPGDAVARLRATALLERAYALYYIGSYPASLKALDSVDSYLGQCTVSDYEGARALIYRALVYKQLERATDALEAIGRAKPVFRMYADFKAIAQAQATEGAVLISLRRYAEALPIELKLAAEVSLDGESRSCALSNAAHCYRELSRFAEAKRAYAEAIVSFERLGLVSRRTVTRFGLARVLCDEGRYEQAIPMLMDLRAEFEELGMADDVAFVSLQLADTFLIQQRPAQVVELCSSAIDYFAKAGLAYGKSAMTALAYLREAAEQGTINRAKVEHVKIFFEVLPKQPQLAFAVPA